MRKWQVKQRPHQCTFGWTIQMTVPGGVILQAVGLALTAALVAGYWPAGRAARQSVVEGLREE